MKAILTGMVFGAALCLFQIFPMAHATAQETLIKTVYVSDKDGFHDQEGNLVNNQTWKVPKGTQVRIVFKFDGVMTPGEEEHEIQMSVLRLSDGTKPEKKRVVGRTKPLSANNMEQTLSFTSGEFSENILKIYCKTDCDGMDYMDNLRIEVE